MSIDGLVTSRPIVAENVTTKEEIDALFDAISYSKGASIIRMIRTFAGDEAFQLGLKVKQAEIYDYRRTVKKGRLNPELKHPDLWGVSAPHKLM